MKNQIHNRKINKKKVNVYILCNIGYSFSIVLLRNKLFEYDRIKITKFQIIIIQFFVVLQKYKMTRRAPLQLFIVFIIY